jgi:hypothetical protein
MIAMLVTAAALGAADLEQIVEPAEPALRTFSIYTSPTSIAGAAAIGSFAYGAPLFHVPVGATFALADSWGLTAELTGTVVPMRRAVGWSLGASIGPTFLPSQRGVEGWFVTPKLMVQVASMPDAFCPCAVFSHGNSGPVDFGPGVSRAYLLGLDAGYTFSTSPVSLGLVLGAAVGYQYDGWDFVTPIGSTGTHPGGTRSVAAGGRPQGLAFTLNLSLVRLGFSR